MVVANYMEEDFENIDVQNSDLDDAHDSLKTGSFVAIESFVSDSLDWDLVVLEIGPALVLIYYTLLGVLDFPVEVLDHA